MAFCHKCGTKADDDAIICSNCGERLILDDTEQQTIAPVQPQMNNIQPNKPQSQVNNIQSSVPQPQRRKSYKLPIILGITVFVIVAFIVAIGLSGGNIDYTATVKTHKPFAVSQNLPYTYNEVFEKYIDSPVWKVRESGKDTAYVDISGTVKGTKIDLVITIKVAPNPDNSDGVLIRPNSVTVNGEKSSTENDTVEFVLAMFSAYDKKIEDLSDLPSIINAIGLSSKSKSSDSANSSDLLSAENSHTQSATQKIELSETYSSEFAGITFNYPSDWIAAETITAYNVAEIVDSKNSTAKFSVNDMNAITPFGDIAEDEESIRKAISEYDGGKLIKFEEVKISEVPAKCVTYQSSGSKGATINRCYWYSSNGSYTISCSYAASEADEYEPIFDAIINTYTISTNTYNNSESSLDNNSLDTQIDNDSGILELEDGLEWVEKPHTDGYSITGIIKNNLSYPVELSIFFDIY